MNTDILTATEAAELLGVSDMTIRRWISNDFIQATKHNRVWQIQRAEVERILEDTDTDRPTSGDAPTDRPTEPATPPTSDESLHWELKMLRVKLETVERENAQLSDETRRLHAELERSQRQLEESLTSVRALTEQNERLTILLANEQAQRMKALPRPFSWVRRLFGRHTEGG
jgi:excisionase family DNA binding protein